MADASGARTVRLPLRDNWRFGGRVTTGATAPDFDDSDFATVTVPHCVVDLSWHNWDPASWAAEWIYRRHFDRPGDGRIFLDFEGAMSASTVTVNGHEFEQHLGGYLPASYEITDLVTERDNVLAVVVDGRWLPVPPDGAPDGPAAVDYLQPAGIYRDVSLRVVPEVFLADVFAKPVDVLRDDRSVHVRATIDSVRPSAGMALRVALRDGGRTLATTTVAVPAGSSVATATLRDLGDIRLWDIDAPNLYEVEATLLVDGRAVHRQSVRIGFREARFEVDGFFLNGRRVKLFGLNRHQIYPYTGMAMPGRVQRRDAEILARELNCNIVRCAHYPQSREFLDACDELGLMVWQEPPGWQYVGDAAWQELVVRDVHDMIVRDRNRPSIVIWGVRVNESANYPELYTRTKEVAYELDGTRPTSGSMTQRSTEDWDQDVFALDDYNHDYENIRLLPPLPDVPYMIAEAVGALTGPHYYRWIDTPDDLAKQAVLHAKVHDIVRSDDRYAGLIGWLAFDYGSLHGWTYMNQKTPGVADIFRVFKPGAAFYQSQVDPHRRPVLEPAFVWDPDVSLSDEALFCTNCDRLEIYGDEKHVATTTPDRARFPHLAYPPHVADLPDGVEELRIDGYVGRELRVTRRMSAGPVRLSLELDDTSLHADGVDATRVLVRVVDSYGNRRPYGQGALTVTVTGPGILVGDNPFDLAESPGVAAFWLRTVAGSAGEVEVSASHPVLGTARSRLTVRR